MTAGVRDEVDEKEDSSHLWSSILKEVASARIGKLPQKKGLIILGDYGTGKSTLVCRLSHKDVPPKSPAIEYHYVDIRDEATDDQTKLSVWVLDGDLIFIPYLKYAINKRNFTDRMVVITVNMEKPWSIMEELEKWAKALEEYINSLDIDVEEMNEYKEALIRQFREYIEPDGLHRLRSVDTNGEAGDTMGPNSTSTPSATRKNDRPTSAAPLHPATAALLGLGPAARNQHPQVPSHLDDDDDDGDDEDGVDGNEEEGENSESKGKKKNKKGARRPSDVLRELPITPGALEKNLGIPIVVVVTKTDVMDDMEKHGGMTEEQFDIIQMHIRRFCLSYGAALIYMSSNNGKNCGLLSNYLQHRIYGFPFTQNAYVIDKDSVFIPAGWDSLKKIELLEQNLAKYRPGDDYSVVVPKPPDRAKRATAVEPEVTCMDDQLFLSRLYTKLQRDSVGSGEMDNGGESHDQPSSLLDASTPTSRPSSGSVSRTRISGGIPGGLASSSSEKVLASFFNNLLNKGPSSRPPPGASAVSPASQGANTASSPDSTGRGEAARLTAQEMQNELERLARVSKEALDKSAPSTEKSS